MGFSREVADVVGNAVAELGRRKRYNRWNVSLSELVQGEDVQELMTAYSVSSLMDESAKDVLRAALFMYGIDVDKHYEVEVCEHRNVYGEAVVCAYFLGIERTDQTWKFIVRRAAA